MAGTRPILLFTAASLTFGARAQSNAHLDINAVRARFHAHGLIGADPALSMPGFEVPQGQGTHALYAGGLWFAGTTSDQQLRVAALKAEAAGESDFYPGPLRTDGTTDAAIMDAYDQVWSVTRQEVEQHIAFFNCLSDPECDMATEFPDGYETPTSFFAWPAINTAPGLATYQAPFYDFNGDGDYQPADGDAPCILGDQALYFVFNDAGGPHVLTGGTPIGLEVQAMPFAYNSGEAHLDNTVFVHYHVINRGTLTLTEAHIGFFNDFDLGCPEDDHAGSDPTRNLLYILNGDDNDQNCLGLEGYGAQPPAFGLTVLKGPQLDPDLTDNQHGEVMPAWNGYGFDDDIFDNERHGLSRAVYMLRDGPFAMVEPIAAVEYAGYLKGRWRDGSIVSYGGDANGGAIPARWVFPNDTDPNGVGTNGQPATAWTEANVNNPPSDRRMLASMGPITLEPGEHIDLLFAYVYARAANGGPAASVFALQQRVDSVRAFAEGLPLWNIAEDVFQGACEGTTITGLGERAEAELLTLFPVPATEEVRFVATPALIGGRFVVSDAQGRTVAAQRVGPGVNAIPVAGLAPGMYVCEITTARTRAVGRLIKE